MLTRLTALDGEAILPLADAKAAARVLHTAEDALITSFRDAAVGHIERVSGIALAEAEFQWTLRNFPCGRIDLPMRPVISVDAVEYYDADGAEQSYLDARQIGNSVYPAAASAWPTSHDYAAVSFTAGLASPDEAPELILAAKLLVSHWYIHREAVSISSMQAVEVPFAVEALIGSYRQVLV